MRKVVIVLVLLVIVIPAGWFFVKMFEGKDPVIDAKLPSTYLNRDYEMSLTVSDEGTGLKEVTVSIARKDKKKVLVDKVYPPVGISGFFLGSDTRQESFRIPVEFWKYGMSDGKATIRISVSDYSWRGWNKGNSSHIEKEVIIDSKPPEIKILTKTHNIEKGGSGLIIYRLFEKDVKAGVRAGDNFFPGYTGMFDDENVYAAFFALDHTQGPGTKISVTAGDQAGNVAEKGFYHYIRDEDFKTDVLNISQKFLEKKMPEFQIGEEAEKRFARADNPLLEKFLYVNQTLRQKSSEKLLRVAAETENRMMWRGKFLRLAGSARQAAFADRRIYKHQGTEIDRAVHMGIDLASTRHARLPAANSGRVVLNEYIGIYGNSVVIDHGFGLFSIYAHLSSSAVAKGDPVEKGDIIGRSGTTGLAGGDHLHFAIAVNTVFVNPVEWWDGAWISNNITSKIDNVRKQLRHEN